MAVYRITAPDGKVLKITGPDGASKEEILAQAQKLYKPKAGPSVEDAQAARGTTMSSVLGDYAELGGKYTPAALLATGADKALSALGLTDEGTISGPVVSVMTGMGGGIGNAIEGVRQAGTKLLGSDEDLALLNQDTEWRKKRLGELTSANPNFAAVGETVGEALPYLLGGEALAGTKLVGKAAPALSKIGTRTALGGAVGAAEGGMSALTREEEAAGVRGDRAKTGALYGGVGANLGPAIQSGGDAWKNYGTRILPEEFLEKIGKDWFGATKDSGPTLDPVRQKISSTVAALRDEFFGPKGSITKVDDKFYNNKMGGAANSPVITRADEAFTSPASVKVSSTVQNSPNLRKVRDGMAGSSNLTGAELSYTDVRKAMAELDDAVAKATDPTDVAAFESMKAHLRSSIDSSAATNPKLRRVVKDSDKAWAEHDKTLGRLSGGSDRSLGSWYSDGMDTKAADDILLSPTSERQFRDLKELVPDATDDVKKAWAARKLLTGDADALSSGSYLRNEMVDNNPAKIYDLNRLDEAMGGTGDRAGKTLTDTAKAFSRKASQLVGGPLEMLVRGMQPPGKKALRKTSAQRLAAALRGSAMTGAMQPQEEVYNTPPPLIITHGR